MDDSSDRLSVPTVLARPTAFGPVKELAGPYEDLGRDPVPTSPWAADVFSRPTAKLDEGSRLVAERYKIEAELGTGGMSHIFRVSHLGMGREFALKIITADLAADPRMRSFFVREAQVLSRMEHPNIVQITDFGVDENLGAFIVMEYLRGETLLAKLRREGRLALSLAMDLASQVADALCYMHDQELVHCDIKAENVLLCPPPVGQRQRPVVKLIDFGLSRTRALGAQLSASEVGGTPPYMSPEQIRGQAPSPSMDIYALGVLLYEMVTGRLPFVGEAEAVLSAHLNEVPRPPSAHLPEPLGEAFQGLILRALSKEPEKRQGSMRQLLYELQTVGDMMGLARRGSRGSALHQIAPIPPLTPHTHCQLCPFPMVRLDLEGRVVMSNPAFARFVRDAVETLFGQPILGTRLPAIYPGLEADLRVVQKEGRMVQRLLGFSSTEGQPVSLLSSLVLERSGDGQAVSVIGILVPLSEGSPLSELEGREGYGGRALR